jgi:hypothetical protein
VAIQKLNIKKTAFYKGKCATKKWGAVKLLLILDLKYSL